MHNFESTLENETHKLLCDLEIQTNHLFSARQTDVVIVKKKKNCRIVDVVDPTDHRVNLKES